MGGILSSSSGGTVYRFSRCIGRGGMGEVYLGMQEGLGGLERLVVIKRIYPQYGEDEHFTGMLLEEARLAASIRHPNVVQILDIGKDAGGYFIVMEYLSGETLVYVTRTLRGRDESVPGAIACRIGAEVAAGLHCAHTATDPAGNPQPVVHRDVTPSNLIVCFNGTVKIVDFGVAKATMHEGQTRGGVKGKMSYLAPEQLHDRPVDGRTDIFQLGICLHELLTGQRLFRGENDHQRAIAVMQQRIPPPSELVPSVPKALDEVVLWALEREPERRPSTADELRRALESAANGIGQVSGHDLGGWMTTEFSERLGERTSFERQCVAEMREGRIATDEIPMTAPLSLPRSVTPSSRDGVASLRSLPQRVSLASLSSPPAQSGEGESVSPFRRAPSVRSRSGSGSLPPPPPRRRWGLVGLIGAAAVVGAGVGIVWILGTSSKSSARAPAEESAPTAAMAAEAASKPPAVAPLLPRQFEVAVSVDPPTAVIEIDGVEVGRGTYRAQMPMDGVRHIMTVRAEGYEAVGLDFADASPPATIVLDRARPAPAAAEHRPAARPVKRPPSMRRDRLARPRSDTEGGDGFDTDNPDPWANEQGASESAEGSR